MAVGIRQVLWLIQRTTWTVTSLFNQNHPVTDVNLAKPGDRGNGTKQMYAFKLSR